MKLQRRLKMIGMIVLCYFFTSFAQNYGWVKVATLGTALQTLEFVDPMHGWAAFGSNAIYRTTDGGSTWDKYASSAPFVVYSISFVDSLNGWCAGNDGSTGDVIHTTDGGKSWVWQYEKFPRQYIGTNALSKAKNITSGNLHTIPPDTGIVLTTLDSGKTWIEKRMADTIGALGRMQFLDSLHGYVHARNIIKTTDGGLSWQILPAIAQIQFVTFLDTLRGWGGYGSSMYRTTDGGLNWVFQCYLFNSENEDLNIRKISFVDSLKGWAFGNIVFQGNITEGIFRTTDGGSTWKQESIGLTGDLDYILDAKMLNDHTGWAVCNRGEVLRYQIITGVVENLSGEAKNFTLGQNYPNPFNPSTTIEYDLPQKGLVRLIVYDVAGREIKQIVNQTQEAGRYRVKFDASGLSSGTYYYTIYAGTYSSTKEMVVIK